MSKRRRFTPAFKAQVVLEVLTGVKSPAQACREHSIRNSILSHWKREFIDHASRVFEHGKAQSQAEKQVCELERMVGRLTMSLEVFKKASLLLRLPQNGSGS